METNYIYIETPGKPIKAWTKGVQMEEQALKQVINTASIPFIYKHVAIMPDMHWGMGATVGSVVATKGAIIPAAVGVDIGCGMIAMKLSVKIEELPDDLHSIRTAIEAAIPHGRTDNGGHNDRGAWHDVPIDLNYAANSMSTKDYKELYEKYPKAFPKDPWYTITHQLCTLGTGNHFIEVCEGNDGYVWLMLHSGSRGVGNRIGTYFISKAREQAETYGYAQYLPDKDLAWLTEKTEVFDDYIKALNWAQDYARLNRQIMMDRLVNVLHKFLPPFVSQGEVINCHHNYAVKENHFGENVWITRKGAVRARSGDLGIIPGSMGTKSYIVKGLGNPDSFTSCSHGAGRTMSRNEAKKRFTVEDHKFATLGVECRKDGGVLDETPGAYKSIDAVIEAERDLVEPIVELNGVICVKG